MSRLSIGDRVFVISFVFMLAGAIVASTVSDLVFVRAIRDEMDYGIQTAVDGLSLAIDSTIARMDSFGRVLGGMDEISRLIHRKDTDALDKLMLLYLNVTDFDTITVTDADGIVLSSPHAAYFVGDNIAGVKYVAPALRGEPVTEIANAPDVGVGLFHGEPITRRGEVIGAVVAGIDFEKTGMLDRLSALYMADLALYYGDMRINTTVMAGGERFTGLAELDIAEEVIGRRRSSYGNWALPNGQTLRAFFRPFVFEGAVVGMLSAGIPADKFSDAANAAMFRAVGSVFAVALFAIPIARLFSRNIKKLSDEKTQQEIFLGLLMKNSPDIILIFDGDGKLIDCADIFLRETGSAFDGVVGETLSDALLDAAGEWEIDVLNSALKAALSDKRTSSAELALDLRRSEESRVYSVSFTPMLDMSSNPICAMAIFHDIGGLLRARDAEAASRAKSALLVNVSREIRAPVEAIIGLCEAELSKSLPPGVRSGMEKIYSSCAELLRIIGDVPDISETEPGKFDAASVSSGTMNHQG